MAMYDLDKRLLALQPYDTFVCSSTEHSAKQLARRELPKPTGNEDLTRALSNLKLGNQELQEACGGEDKADTNTWRGQPCACFHAR